MAEHLAQTFKPKATLCWVDGAEHCFMLKKVALINLREKLTFVNFITSRMTSHSPQVRHLTVVNCLEFEFRQHIRYKAINRMKKSRAVLVC